MRKFDRTNMKYNNPAGDLLTELEAADLTSNKVDSLASSGVVCTISVECGSIFTLACWVFYMKYMMISSIRNISISG